MGTCSRGHGCWSMSQKARRSRGRASLAHEAFDELLVVQLIGRNELECDALVELGVAGCNDDAHATLADDPLDAVLAAEDVALLDVAFPPGHRESQPTRFVPGGTAELYRDLS